MSPSQDFGPRSQRRRPEPVQFEPVDFPPPPPPPVPNVEPYPGQDEDSLRTAVDAEMARDAVDEASTEPQDGYAVAEVRDRTDGSSWDFDPAAVAQIDTRLAPGARKSRTARHGDRLVDSNDVTRSADLVSGDSEPALEVGGVEDMFDIEGDAGSNLSLSVDVPEKSEVQTYLEDVDRPLPPVPGADRAAVQLTPAQRAPLPAEMNMDEREYKVRRSGEAGTQYLTLDAKGNVADEYYEKDTDEVASGAAVNKRLAKARAARIAAINKAKRKAAEGKRELVSEEAATAPLMPPSVLSAPLVPEMPPLPSTEPDSAELQTEPMGTPKVPATPFDIPPAPEALPVQPAEGIPEQGLGERLAAKADAICARAYGWIDKRIKAIAQVSAPMQQAYERWQKNELPKTQNEVAAELREIRRSSEGKGLIGTGLALLTLVGLAIGVERSQPETAAPTLPESSLRDNTPQQSPEFVPTGMPVQREVRPVEMGEPSAVFARPEQVIKSGEGAWHVLEQQRPEASEDEIRSTLAAYELLDRGFTEDYRVAVNWKPDGSLQFTDLLTGADVTASIRDYTYEMEPTVASAGIETTESTAVADLDALLDDLFPETVEQVRGQRVGEVVPVSAETPKTSPMQKVEAPSQMESLGSAGLNNLLDTMFPIDDVAADSESSNSEEAETDLL